MFVKNILLINLLSTILFIQSSIAMQSDQEGQEEIINSPSDNITLHNFSTIFVDDDGKTFALTPFEKINIDLLKNSGVSEYILFDINFSNQYYNEDGSNITLDGMVYSKSLSEEIARKHNRLTISLWLASCHFIVVKSKTRNRYWFLHYDPWQTRDMMNMKEGYKYSRPNYADLNPRIPYENSCVSLAEDEDIEVLVVHVSSKYNVNDYTNAREGNFDLSDLKDRLGNRAIFPLKIIALQDISMAKLGHKTECFDIEYIIPENKIICKQSDNKSILIEIEDIFNKDNYNVNIESNVNNNYSTTNTTFQAGFTFYKMSLASSPITSAVPSPREEVTALTDYSTTINKPFEKPF